MLGTFSRRLDLEPWNDVRARSILARVRRAATRPLRPSEPARETLLFVLCAVAGVLVVAVILSFDRWLGTPGWSGYTKARREALREPDWALWLTLVLAQGALWGVLLPLLVRLHRGLRGALPTVDLVTVLAPLIALSAGVDVVRYSMQVKSPLPGHFGKVTVITWIGTAVALIAIAGIVRAAHAAALLDVTRDRRETLSEYLSLNAHLRQFLFIAGAAVAGAVLAAGALQDAIDGYRGQTGRPETALLYGLFLSTLLAAAYVPAFSALRAKGEQLLEELEPLSDPSNAAWPIGTPRRRELRAHLQLDAGLVDNLRVGIAVLAPLASGLLSLLLT